MARENTNSAKLGALLRFLAALEANRDDLQHLEVSRTQLASMLSQAQEFATQQAAFIASKQEASRQFQIFLLEGERVATVLRFAVKQHYGIRAEKLAEFGLQPFRGRSRRSPAPQEPPVPPSPSTEIPAPPSPTTE